LRGAERLDEALRVAAAVASRIEGPLAARAASAADELAELAARDARLRRDAGEIEARARDAERLAGGRSTPATQSHPRALRAQAEELTARADAAAEAERAAAEQAEAASRALAETGPTGRIDVVLLERITAQAARLARTLTVETASIEALLRRGVETG